MGVLLYPEGLTGEQMEQLAGVPAGTWNRLTTHEAIMPRNHNSSKMGTWHEVLDHDPQMMALYHFKLFGFGKLTREALNILGSMGVDKSCGHTSKYDRVQALLRAQGIQSDVIKSVSWS